MLKTVDKMQTEIVLSYKTSIENKKQQLCLKRIFDLVVAVLLMVIFLPVMAVLCVAIFIEDGKNPIFKQERVTIGCKKFEIYKFRTMKVNSKNGFKLDYENVTKVGKFIRKVRIDEVLQLINIIKGDMTFVGTRPEIPLYVEQYSDEMYATLLMRAGLTSQASIEFKDEAKYFADNCDEEYTYINEVLPRKMALNLQYLHEFSILKDLKILCKTIISVFM